MRFAHRATRQSPSQLRVSALRASVGFRKGNSDVPHWWLTKDGDQACLELYERHYSSNRRNGSPGQFVGPGEHIVLRTFDADALFVWRRFVDDAIPKQHGINCAVFRNEGPILASELVRQADAVADFAWPGARHYTYVNEGEVRSTNPGFCFLAAGWRRCGRTQGGLLILERLSNCVSGRQRR